MKYDVLRIQNLKVLDAELEKLEYINLSFMGGICASLQGLTHSGKRLLAWIIAGKKVKYTGKIFVDQLLILENMELKNLVYCIQGNNYMIENWTVAEYIALVEGSGKLGFYKPTQISNEVRALFDKLDIHINVNRTLRELSEIEKRTIDFAKSYYKNKKIIIINDEFEGCSKEDIEGFRALMNRNLDTNKIFILNSNSYNVNTILPDTYIVFKKGQVVKKVKREKIDKLSDLDVYMLEESASNKKVEMDSYERVNAPMSEEVYGIRDLILSNGESYSFEFKKGRIYTLLTLDCSKKEELFNLLRGSAPIQSGEIQVEGVTCTMKGVSKFVKKKIVAVQKIGTEKELILKMSLGENLLIPSLFKLNSWEYVTNEKKLMKMLESEIEIQEDGEGAQKQLQTNDYIKILLERWCVFKPKVLILLEPFFDCDIYGVSLIRSYIKRIVDMQTAVIVIKSRKEYMNDISDEIINLD